MVATPEGIHLTLREGVKGSLIAARNEYKDFDLKLEWKSPAMATSGIFIRYLGDDEWDGRSGPEAEVCGSHATSCQGMLYLPGSSYGLFPVDSARRDWARPNDQWNQFRIIAFGKRIAHYNIRLELPEHKTHSLAWEQAYTAGKYQRIPVFRKMHSSANSSRLAGCAGLVKFAIRAGCDERVMDGIGAQRCLLLGRGGGESFALGRKVYLRSRLNAVIRIRWKVLLLWKNTF